MVFLKASRDGTESWVIGFDTLRMFDQISCCIICLFCHAADGVGNLDDIICGVILIGGGVSIPITLADQSAASIVGVDSFRTIGEYRFYQPVFAVVCI